MTREEALKFVKENPEEFKKLDEKFRDDEEIARETLNKNVKNLEYVGEKL